jgi:uncharacterized protein involved in exopolysaccharide biosynthesis
MEAQNSGFRHLNQTIQSLTRDALAVTFRRRHLIRKAFLWTLLGGILAVMVFGIGYESQSEIVIRPWARTPASVTPDDSPRPLLPGDNSAVEEAINSEIELLTSDDILTHVVVTCALQYGEQKWYTPYKLAVYRAIPGYWDTLTPKAVSKLNNDLEIDEVKSSNMLTISYTAKEADESSCVTHALLNFYMAKHVAAWRPAKMFDFFSQQADGYQKRLSADEQKLVDFARDQDAVDPQVQMSLAVNQASQFLSSARQTQASILGTEAQIRASKSLAATLPPRVPANQTVSDNFQLIADLKTSLVQLELQRTQLLVKYDPSYPLVKSIDTQIAQTQQAIADQDAQPVHENTSDQNPVYTQVQESLATTQTMLPSLQAKEGSEAGFARAYHDEALAYEGKAIQQTDLQREVNAMQSNYLLYLSKREQARIEDMLDARRVDNVNVVKQPTIPVIPSFSPLLLVALAFVLAAIIGVALAFVVDYLDPSFRTPDEVQEFLSVPVFASIPERGQEAAIGVTPKNGR